MVSRLGGCFLLRATKLYSSLYPECTTHLYGSMSGLSCTVVTERGLAATCRLDSGEGLNICALTPPHWLALLKPRTVATVEYFIFFIIEAGSPPFVRQPEPCFRSLRRRVGVLVTKFSSPPRSINKHCEN